MCTKPCNHLLGGWCYSAAGVAGSFVCSPSSFPWKPWGKGKAADGPSSSQWDHDVIPGAGCCVHPWAWWGRSLSAALPFSLGAGAQVTSIYKSYTGFKKSSLGHECSDSCLSAGHCLDSGLSINVLQWDLWSRGQSHRMSLSDESQCLKTSFMGEKRSWSGTCTAVVEGAQTASSVLVAFWRKKGQDHIYRGLDTLVSWDPVFCNDWSSSLSSCVST